MNDLGAVTGEFDKSSVRSTNSGGVWVTADTSAKER